MKLGQKIILGFLLVAFFACVVAKVALNNQKVILEEYVKDHTFDREQEFGLLVGQDTKMLSAALEIFIKNPVYKELFIEKDRQKLYNYAQELFEHLKREFGITHIYFILPDGHCFVRIHNEDIYGDMITRKTFYRARDTKKLAVGLELGKTAFALRAVSPYYDGDELLGYVEFGEEIDHFLKMLKRQSQDEFILLGDKEKMDRKKWNSVLNVHSEKDQWDEFKEHVIIGSTAQRNRELFKEIDLKDIVEQIEKGTHFLGSVQEGDEGFAYGGVLIKDIEGEHIGELISFVHIPKGYKIAEKMKGILILLMMGLLLFVLGLGMYLSHSISAPLIKLKDFARKIGEGDLNAKLDIQTSGEIKELADVFNKMAMSLKKTTTSVDALNKEIDERKQAEQALEGANKNLVRNERALKNILFDLNRANEELKEAQMQLLQTEKMSAIGQLSAGVAHEVKNPLAIISLAIDSLKGHIPSMDEKMQRYFRMITEATERANKIIGDLMDFSRYSELQTIDVKILEALDSTIKLFENSARIKGVDIVRDFKCPEDALVLGDPQLLEQVFLNLLGNALDAITDEKGTISVTVSAGEADKKQDKQIEVKISDTGCGISDEIKGKIFNPFFTTKEQGKGTGLGLSIVFMIIENHKGSIKVESKENEGTTFIIMLPVKNVEPA